MKSLYLGGPMAHCTLEERTGWRKEVKALLSGIYVFHDPMDNDLRSTSITPDQVVPRDKEMIDKSDIVLFNIFKEGSAGTAMELMFAYISGKHTVVIHPKAGFNLNSLDWETRNAENYEPLKYIPNPWYTAHASVMFKTGPEAINYLIRQAVLPKEARF